MPMGHTKTTDGIRMTGACVGGGGGGTMGCFTAESCDQGILKGKVSLYL